MLISYYKDDDLIYTNRRRYKTFSKLPYFQEKQRSVLLGDGAYTTVKTSSSNICNYVTIYDDINHKETRWYVTSYNYLNGGQVQLNLQRDVIGEFGLEGVFGKIERGYTESILRNSKELQLNQILKKRAYLKPTENLYGRYQVDNHNNELWGIMYFTKPVEYDPNTGDLIKSPDSININIPAFAPKDVVDYKFYSNGYKITGNPIAPTLSFRTKITLQGEHSWGFIVYIDYVTQVSKSNTILYYPNSRCVAYTAEENEQYKEFDVEIASSGEYSNDERFKDYGEDILTRMADTMARELAYESYPNYRLPIYIPEVEEISDIDKYNGVTIKNGNKYYKCSVDDKNIIMQGTDLGQQEVEFDLLNVMVNSIKNSNLFDEFTSYKVNKNIDLSLDSLDVEIPAKGLILNELSAAESGTFVIDVTKQLIDEPYNIAIFPLYDVTITENENKYSVSREDAFMIFNTVIQYLSGENGYLVDAQVYPYCPNLTEISNSFTINRNSEKIIYPVFSINSTSYDHECEVDLNPLDDVKKEYIEREYSIIPPDKNDKFTFNFYDYKISKSNLRVKIKTALKPFSIISAAVIIPDENSLVNMTYESDLRGCLTTANGFECSLSSNAFETYKRQNSTYQQLFDVDVDELRKQHEVERKNERTSIIVNTTTATAMGAIAGGSLAGSGLLGIKQAIGAGAGAAVAGSVVGAAMGSQYAANNDLRQYEEEIQQTRFDLNIQAIRNMPNSVNRISSFNEILFRDDSFWFVIETYECSEFEKGIVDEFIDKYAYSIGVFDSIIKYVSNGKFIRSTIVSSNYPVVLSNIASNELKGGIYYIE